MRIIYTFILVVSFFLLTCQIKNEKTWTHQLKLSEKISLPIDSTVPGVAGNCNYFENNYNEFILYRNHLQNSLLIFDLNKRKLHKEILFIKQGPGAIAKPVAIQMRTADSIFVLSAYVKQLTIINQQGVKISTFDIDKKPTQATPWSSEPCYNFHLSGDKLIFETTPLASPFQPATFYKTPLGAIYDWRRGTLNANWLAYPAMYTTGDAWGFYHNFHSISLIDDTRFVVSFPLDRAVQVYSTEGKLLTAHEAGSDYLGDAPKPYKQPEEFKSYYLHVDSYGAIYYDKYRGVYYRFAFQKLDDVSKATVPVDPATYKKASVIILDKNLKKIGETVLPENTHYFFNCFVGKNGLYISDSHPNNKNNKENELTFSCYTLQINK